MVRFNDKKAFTVIELLAAISIMGILFLLAVPNFSEQNKNATIKELASDTRILQDASVKYYLENGDWPRLSNNAYSSEEVELFSDKIYNLTGEEVHLDPNGKYYDIDYNKLSPNAKIEGEEVNYILQNPVGKVYSLYKTNKAGVGRKPSPPSKPEITVPEKPEVEVPEKAPENPGSTVPEKPEVVLPVNKGIYTEKEIEKLVSKGYKKVSTVEDLSNVRSGMKKKYIQVNNIDLKDSKFDGNWVSIGTSNNEFEGLYDGGGFSIKGLKSSDKKASYVGLFGKIKSATIKNVILNVDFSGASYVGGIAGYGSLSSDILNSKVTGMIEGTEAYIGGLVGYSRYSEISDSESTATLEGTGNYVGGLVGYSSLSKLETSSATGEVSGRNYLGGLVGYVESSIIKNNYSTGSVAGSESYVGGLVGYNYLSNIDNSYSSGLFSGVNYVGGLYGYNYVSIIKDSYYEQTTALTNNKEGRLTKDMKRKDNYSGWDFKRVWEINERVSFPTLKK